MKNYLERFVGNPHSFQRKIITIYLVLTIIPMLLIALIITGVYYQSIVVQLSRQKSKLFIMN